MIQAPMRVRVTAKWTLCGVRNRTEPDWQPSTYHSLLGEKQDIM